MGCCCCCYCGCCIFDNLRFLGKESDPTNGEEEVVRDAVGVVVVVDYWYAS